MFAEVFTGIGAAFYQTAPSSISVAWFPPHLRTLATSVMIQAQPVGSALGFFIGSVASHMHLFTIFGEVIVKISIILEVTLWV